jgi:hypothetical protein
MNTKDFELYLSKLNDCDKKFFDEYNIGDEDVFFQEVHDILIQENYAPEEFAESLITYYHEHGDFGNAVNHRIAKWLIYQDNEYYEYCDSDLDNADKLAGALCEIELEAGTDEWRKTGSYWSIIAECLGYDFGESSSGCMEFYLDNPSIGTPYPDYTTAETKLILSEMCYDHLCWEAEGDMDTENALRILSESDIRRAKIKSLDKALNKKAPEIYERLCRNTAIALYYCYHQLGDEKKALKELKNANISAEEETLTAFSNNSCKGIEFENPLCKLAGNLNKKGQFSSTEERKNQGKKRKRNKSVVSKIYKFFRKLIK